MTVTTIPTAGIADDAVTNAKTAFNDVPFRNLIINGDMSIAQRGTSQSIGSGSGYIIDRWRDGAIYNTVAPTGVFTVSQSTDVPTGQGFVSSQKWDCTTAQSSLGVEQGWGVQQRIEAQNLTYLQFGTSSAKTLTLTFWIKSNKTGTYGIEVRSHDASRQFISSYTIDSANTWEKKTITITGDTGGTGINNDNGIGFWVRWIWSAGTTIDGATLNSWTATATEIAPTGQVNLADSTSNELYWTGVQLEVGTSASDFEFLPFDVNERRCFRYFQDYASFKLWTTALDGNTSTRLGGSMAYNTRMRATPSVSKTNNTGTIDSQTITDRGYSVFAEKSNRGTTTNVTDLEFDSEL
jgi:hypothetical protein